MPDSVDTVAKFSLDFLQNISQIKFTANQITLYWNWVYFNEMPVKCLRLFMGHIILFGW